MILGEGTPNEECIMPIEYGSLVLSEPIKNSHPVGTTISPPYSESPCEMPFNETQTPLGKKSVLSSLKDIDEKSKLPSDEIQSEKINRISLDSEIPSDGAVESIKSKSNGPSNISETTSGVEYITDENTGIVYDKGTIIKDTYKNVNGDLVTDTYQSDSRGEFTKIKSEVVGKTIWWRTCK